MDNLNYPEDRLLYELEQFLVKNDASNYLHYFLRSMYPRIISGEIVFILAPIDTALARLVSRSGKSLEKISNTSSGIDILTNFLSSGYIQRISPVYTAINGAYLSNQDNVNKLNSKISIRLGNLFMSTIDGIINMPGQLEKLKQVNNTYNPASLRSAIIGGNPRISFEDFPNELIRQIGLNLSLDNLIYICRVNIQFNNILCNGENFWQEKIRKDFPQQQPIFNETWKNTYQVLSRKLYTFGSGINNQLGSGKRVNSYRPLLIEELSSPTMVACGESHTAVIANGLLYTFSIGLYGQLGHGVEIASQVHPYLDMGPKPALVEKLDTGENLENVTFVACGNNHTAIISNNRLYTFGSGQNGQLGHGDRHDQNRPKLVEKSDNGQVLSNVTFVACGTQYTAIISNGQLYTFGAGADGRLGHGDDLTQTRPRLVEESNDGEKLENITVVSCGGKHTAVISNNRLYTFGAGEEDQLGHGDNRSYNRPKLVKALDNVTFVACGQNHTAAIILGGRLYTFGLNTYGRLGRHITMKTRAIGLVEELDNGKRLENVTFVACGDEHTALISNGRLYTFGNGQYGQLGRDERGGDNVNRPKLVPGLNDVAYVACGTNHTATIAK